MISVVSPVYNSETCLEELVRKIIHSTKKISKIIEIVLVDDGSSDKSWNKIKLLKKKYKFVKGIKLNKNYGQHQAIFIGIQNSSFDITIILDCDLQDNPKFIPEMYKKYKKYKKPVIIQHSYEEFTLSSRFISNMFWVFLSIISFKKFSPYLGNYLLIDSFIKKKYLKIRSIGYLYGDLLFQENEFTLIRKKRFKGIRNKTTYNFLKLIKLASKLVIKYNILNRPFYNIKSKKNFYKYIEKII